MTRIVDLSFPIRPHFRWTVAREIRSSHARGDNFESSVMTLACHAYTHVDAPRHFLPDDRAITDMPIDQWVGEAAVVDLTHLGRNREVAADDLDTRAGHVRAGDIALLWTDWPKRTSVDDERFWRDAPYTSRGACEWLVARGVKAVGYDYPPDYAVRTGIFEKGRRIPREDNTTHFILFPAGITVIEYLTNLEQARRRSILFRFRGCSVCWPAKSRRRHTPRQPVPANRQPGCVWLNQTQY